MKNFDYWEPLTRNSFKMLSTFPDMHIVVHIIALQTVKFFTADLKQWDWANIFKRLFIVLFMNSDDILREILHIPNKIWKINSSCLKILLSQGFSMRMLVMKCPSAFSRSKFFFFYFFFFHFFFFGMMLPTVKKASEICSEVLGKNSCVSLLSILMMVHCFLMMVHCFAENQLKNSAFSL